MNFTNKELRIAIAEVLGYTYHGDPDLKLEAILCWSAPNEEYCLGRLHELPNWPESLDACHEMEKWLLAQCDLGFNDDIWIDYLAWLGLECRPSGSHHATALQRSLAFLRVKRPEMFQQKD